MNCPHHVDFYSPKLKLIIEIDGYSHAEQVIYDQERTAFLNQHGLKVIRYRNADVMKNLNGVFDDLFERIGERTPSSVLQGDWLVLE